MNNKITKITSLTMQDESNIQKMRSLINTLGKNATIVDFEEVVQLKSVRESTQLWYLERKLIGFAFVDDYNNLNFEIDPQYSTEQLKQEILTWGECCMKERNRITGQQNTLDACFGIEDTWQIDMLKKYGFELDEIRSLRFMRSLDDPIIENKLPEGFWFRSVTGEEEVENLVQLHRAAFGTDNMTVEARLAIMRSPQYDQEMDFVVVAPNGELAAFCICGKEEENEYRGYTDPVGTHPHYQGLGLGKAIMTIGLWALKKKGVNIVELGTSSKNLAMQKLAESLGFICVSEKLWFYKNIK